MTQPLLTREGIALALAEILTGIPGVTTFSRRWRKMENCAPEDQPFISLTPGREQPRNTQGLNGVVWVFEFVVTIYAYEPDPAAAPASRLNPIMDALEAALRPAKGLPGQMQWLGDATGRIQHAWISGPVETDEGVLGPQAIAIVPIEVEVVL